jgi:hypothetical protein
MSIGSSVTNQSPQVLANRLKNSAINEKFGALSIARVIKQFDDIAQMITSPLKLGDVASCNARFSDGEYVSGLHYVIETGTGDGYHDHTLNNGLCAKLVRSATETQTQVTWHVSPSGNDETGRGTSSLPYRTIQRAYDQLPENILHQQTIQLADGDYRTSSIASSEQPRAAVLWGHNKNLLFRTALSGENLSGPIVIRGNSSDNTAVEVVTTSDYTYGIYNTTGQLALQDLSVKTSGSNGGLLVVSHRNTSHVYLKNCIVDGVFAGRSTAGVSTESGGQLEFIDGKIKNLNIGALQQSAGENMTFSTRSEAIFENNELGVLSKNGGFVQLVAVKPNSSNIAIIDDTNTSGIKVISGAHLSVRGASTTEFCKIDASIELEQASMDLVFAETLDTVNLVSSKIRYNASNYQRSIIADASTVELVTSNSYAVGQTANTDVNPIQLLNDSMISQEGVNNINGSSGVDRPSVFPSVLTATTNAETMTPVAKRLACVAISSAASGSYINCQISADLAYEGQVMNVIHHEPNDNSVQLIGSGAHMLFSDPIKIGKNTGDYTGAIFQCRGSKWHLVGLGQLIS